MAWFEFFKALFSMVIIVGIMTAIGFFLYRSWKRSDLRFKLKYNVFRRKYQEKDVEWCLNALERGWDEVKIKKFLLINGTSFNKIDEMCFIFRQLKGGDANGKKRS